MNYTIKTSLPYNGKNAVADNTVRFYLSDIVLDVTPTDNRLWDYDYFIFRLKRFCGCGLSEIESKTIYCRDGNVFHAFVASGKTVCEIGWTAFNTLFSEEAKGWATEDWNKEIIF